MTPADQMERALRACPAGLLAPLRGKGLLLTGATGFVGSWVLFALERLNAQGFAIRARCVSRDPASFLGRRPDLKRLAWLEWLTCEARDFASLPIARDTSVILHMAASADAQANLDDPLAAVDTILAGAHGCIALARRHGLHLHMVSSGAVYGARLASQGPAREDQVTQSAPDPLLRAHCYANAKRMAEALLSSSMSDYCVSRPFAFLGPLLPLDKHFAAGNFISDACAGRPINVRGDGAAVRSYLHPADLALALLVLLARKPQEQAFNIGSAEPVSIGELAHEIARTAGSPPPKFGKAAPGGDAEAYWPDTTRIESLGLKPSASRRQMIEDALAWARQCQVHAGAAVA